MMAREKELGALLHEAHHLVTGDRRADYGDAKKSLSAIAKKWSIILGQDITAHQVCLMMIGLKLCRECAKHKYDNLVDIAGYAALADYVNDDDGESVD